MNSIIGLTLAVALLPMSSGFLFSTTVPTPLAVGPLSSYYAISSDNTLYAWGNNELGTIGIDDATAENPNPILEDAVFVTASQWGVMAIDENGTLWGAGSDLYGQIYGKKSSPDVVMREMLHDVTMASFGDSFAIALKTDGTVWVWGLDTSSTTQRKTIPPTMVAQDIRFATAGGKNCYVISERGALRAWGTFDRFQSGEKITQVTLWESGVVAASQSGSDLLVRLDDGTLWAVSTLNSKYSSPVFILDHVKFCGEGIIITENNELLVWDIRSGETLFEQNAQPVKVMENVLFAVQSPSWTYAVTVDGEGYRLEAAVGANTNPEEKNSTVPSLNPTMPDSKKSNNGGRNQLASTHNRKIVGPAFVLMIFGVVLLYGYFLNSSIVNPSRRKRFAIWVFICIAAISLYFLVSVVV